MNQVSHTGSYYAASANDKVQRPKLTEDITADICVVGSGFTGLSSALHLAEKGFKVVVVEGSRIGFGASGRNGGQLVNSYSRDMDFIERNYGQHVSTEMGKMAFEGDVWQWHQDYGTWFNDDLMPSARAMNVAIFLDEVTEFNGPLLFIPGSHKKGVIKAKHDLTTTSYPLWIIENDLIRQLVDRAGGHKGGIVSPQGPAGSMILFHSCLVHASSNNLSPFNRTSVYLSLCAVSNHIRRFKRKEYIAHRNFSPIKCLPDDCLIKDYDVELPWKKGVPSSAYQTSLAELLN